MLIDEPLWNLDSRIVLLIAGIGIMNIMIVSLIERTREIGTLESLGLKNRKVLSIFMCEAGIIGLMGDIFGTVLGFGLASPIALLLNGGALLQWSGASVYADITIVPELSVEVALAAIIFGGADQRPVLAVPGVAGIQAQPDGEALRHE
jgi:ABC-type antimicrobial peptide transport system permease subunit